MHKRPTDGGPVVSGVQKLNPRRPIAYGLWLRTICRTHKDRRKPLGLSGASSADNPQKYNIALLNCSDDIQQGRCHVRLWNSKLQQRPVEPAAKADSRERPMDVLMRSRASVSESIDRSGDQAIRRSGDQDSDDGETA